MKGSVLHVRQFSIKTFYRKTKHVPPFISNYHGSVVNPQALQKKAGFHLGRQRRLVGTWTVVEENVL
jgi:hypothetical protein